MAIVETPSGPVELTDKQFAALELAARHQNTKQIARTLEISPRTVQAHLDAARSKMGAATRGEAIQLLLDTPSGDTCSSKPIPPSRVSAAEDPASLAEIEFHDVGVFRDPAPWDEASGRFLSGIEPADLSKIVRSLLVVAIAVLAMVLFGSGLMVVDALSRMRGG